MIEKLANALNLPTINTLLAPLSEIDRNLAMWHYMADFFYLLRNIFPTRARIGKKTLSVEDTKNNFKRILCEQISRNVNIACNAENIFDWCSHDPNIVMNHKSNEKVVLNSSDLFDGSE